MKVHITLVGGQPAPVYYGIMATQPDRIVFIYSDESRSTAKIIADELDNIPSTRIKFDPVDPNKIEQKVIDCSKRYTDDTVTVNISGGTKPWAFYFAKLFGAMPNATLFYVDQNNMLWNLTEKKSQNIEFSIDTQFKLHGNTLTNYISFESINNDDQAVVVQIEELMDFCPHKLLSLISQLREHPNQTTVVNSGGSLTWEPGLRQFKINISHRNKEKTAILRSAHCRHLLIDAGWFEYKVAKVLTQWDKARQIRLNCIFPYKGKAAKNEIDIIIDTGYKPLFVECKTQIHNITDIDKFNSAVKNYGGMGSKALFVTNQPFSDLARQKCYEYGIITFSFSDNHMGLDNNKALTTLLDSELFNINPK